MTRAAARPGVPSRVAGTYNECAQLSAVIVKANTNAENPNTRAVLFHLGKFIPTGVPDTYGFNDIEPSASAGDTVALRLLQRHARTGERGEVPLERQRRGADRQHARLDHHATVRPHCAPSRNGQTGDDTPRKSAQMSVWA